VHLQASDFAWAIRRLPTYVFSIERGSGTWPVAKAIFDECAFALSYRPAVRLPFRADTDYVVYRRAPEVARHLLPEGDAIRQHDVAEPGLAKRLAFLGLRHLCVA